MINFTRKDGRQLAELRPCLILPHFLQHNPGSVLISMGNTKVICSALIEDKVPFFLRGSGHGWLTAEYAMLPSSTPTRTHREFGNVRHGRSVEIQRLIGRSLRMAFDLTSMGEKTIVVDCDVIQADGGTRTASITGSFVAVCLALHHRYGPGSIPQKQLASVSIGLVDHMMMLDLNYEEDVRADLDINLVMDSENHFIEIQGTGEKSPFSRQELEQVLDLGQEGIAKLHVLQKQILEELLQHS
jgi:ribonuclease PH